MSAAEASAVFYRHMVREQIALIRRRRVGGSLYPSAMSDLRRYLREYREARRDRRPQAEEDERAGAAFKV